MVDLLGCPFCNTAPAFGRMIEPDQVTIGCNNDGCLVQLCVVSDVESEAVKAWNTRATLQPSGERREAIKALAHRFWSIHPSEIAAKNLTREEFYEREMTKLLASGLVQDEAGWRDISTAPKDMSEIIVLCGPKDVRLGWYFAPSSTTFGWRDQRQKPINPTHWMPMPAPPIRSARDGGAS